MMRRSLAVMSALVLFGFVSAAEAQTWALYRAETAGAVKVQGSVVAAKVDWDCAASSCVGKAPEQLNQLEMCRDLARLVGPLKAYQYGDTMMDAADLQQCNSDFGAKESSQPTEPPNSSEAAEVQMAQNEKAEAQKAEAENAEARKKEAELQKAESQEVDPQKVDSSWTQVPAKVPPSSGTTPVAVKPALTEISKEANYPPKPTQQPQQPYYPPKQPQQDPGKPTYPPNPYPAPPPATVSTPPATISTGGNWDFEFGTAAWRETGNAFTSQPTAGDNVLAERVRTDMILGADGIGGDYWKKIPYPIGHHADFWVGTFEDRSLPQAPPGGTQGEVPRGTLTSGDFPLDADHRFISFEVGGGSDLGSERVELQVRGDTAADTADVVRIVSRLRANPGTLGAGGAVVFGGVDGTYAIALAATGRRSEVMRQVDFEVPPEILARAGRTGRIRIVDNSSNTWGHINVDDFRFGAAVPAPRTMRLWGFADTHSHPMNDLAFGGGVIQGRLYARDGSVAGTEAFRRAAFPPLFENLNWPAIGAAAGTIGSLINLLSPIFLWAQASNGMLFLPPIIVDPTHGAAIAEAARIATLQMRSGYPDMRAYPSTSMMAGQTVYSEWVRRSYDGGLRLMSALAVNTWVVSAHPIKRTVIGTTVAEDDKGSGDAQVADIKTWALRPENRGWVEIALTPTDARRIIGANKLAIIIGLELDSVGNFVPNDHWRRPLAIVMPPDSDAAGQRVAITKELDRLYDLGVRQIGPFHYVSGVWGGAAMYQRMFNDVNRGITGNNVEVVSGDADGIRYRLDMDSWGGTGPISRTAITGDTTAAGQSHPSWAVTGLGHKNSMRLTQAGGILFDEMANRGMLIDLDHAGLVTTNDLLDRASRRQYPVMSSHTDYMDLGFTGTPGRGAYSHNAVDDNDLQNAAAFGTTTQGSLRHEGLATRFKIKTIARLQGVTGAILWLPRRMDWGSSAIPNDNDGSSKTWAQCYQYAVEMTGGHGVALSTDRITLGPRFGPNSAYMLGQEHDTLPHRDEDRFRQADLQQNGVRYNEPIIEWRAFRTASLLPPARPTPWQKTPKSESWESYPLPHEDAWNAMAAFTAGRNPRTMPRFGIAPDGDPRHVPNHGIDLSNDRTRPDRIINYVFGLQARNPDEVEVFCGGVCDDDTLSERYAPYVVKGNTLPARRRGLAKLDDNVRWFRTVYNQWNRMTGTNDPLRRIVFGNRDYDVNIDGVAHYGMIPDFLQDVANSHPRHGEVGTYLTPLFSSAEDYIQMWEAAWRAAPRTR